LVEKETYKYLGTSERSELVYIWISILPLPLCETITAEIQEGQETLALFLSKENCMCPLNLEGTSLPGKHSGLVSYSRKVCISEHGPSDIWTEFDLKSSSQKYFLYTKGFVDLLGLSG
jgi:hypothetical protein